MNIAINGFGRIGRLVCRLLCQQSHMKLVAINDLVPTDNLAYLLKYDSVHQTNPQNIVAHEHCISIDDHMVATFAEKDPEKLPWKRLNVDYVVESTGIFTTLETAGKHLKAGAKRVVISAPAKDNIKTLVMGVNETSYDPVHDYIVSNASCTTNCLAPIAKVLLDEFGIEEGLMTTIHAMTASQPTVDGHVKKDWRGGRAAGHNIIPSSTGAAHAVALCLPQIKGKLTGMSFRVPVLNVSAVDLTVRLSTETNYLNICEAMKHAANNSLKGILSYCDRSLVSSDFIGDKHSAIFDVHAGIALNHHFYKLVAWYDNEMGYAARVLDLLCYLAKCE